MSMQTYRADQIARFFLSLVDPEDNDISNLKLQKLCYYAQGLCTAMRGAPLFSDRMEAWDHGPVVPSLYHDYKQHGSDPIPRVENFEPSQIAPQDREALTDIYTYYAQFSAWRLRNMTHEEAPWVDASTKADKEIKPQALIDYFSLQVDDAYTKRVYS